MCLREPGMKRRKTDFKPEADDRAGKRGQRRIRTVYAHTGEHQRTGAGVTSEKIYPGCLANALLLRLKRHESCRSESHRLPGEKKRKFSVSEHDRRHGHESREEKEPKARQMPPLLTMNIGRRMNCGGRSDCKNRYAENTLYRQHNNCQTG